MFLRETEEDISHRSAGRANVSGSQLVGPQPKTCQKLLFSHNLSREGKKGGGGGLTVFGFSLLKSSYITFFLVRVCIFERLHGLKLVVTLPTRQREPERCGDVHLCFFHAGHHHSDGGAGGAHQDTQSSHLCARQVLHAVRSPRD